MNKRQRKKWAKLIPPYNSRTQRTWSRRFPERVVSRYPFHHWLSYYRRERAYLDANPAERAEIFRKSDEFERGMIRAEWELRTVHLYSEFVRRLMPNGLPDSVTNRRWEDAVRSSYPPIFVGAGIVRYRMGFEGLVRAAQRKILQHWPDMEFAR